MKLTDPQAIALLTAFDKDGAAHRKNAGAAYTAVINRLVDRGLLNGSPPHSITLAGLEALQAHFPNIDTSSKVSPFKKEKDPTAAQDADSSEPEDHTS